MKLRTLGTSGLATPPLILGGNVFGWTADEKTSFALLDAFVAGGGTMIDTADVYSAWVPGHVGGESESIIGRWLKARGGRDKVLIATKVGMLDGEGSKGLAPTRIAAAVEDSLRRLNTDYLDLYYAHQDDPSQSLEDVLGAFDALVRAGKVRAVGGSNLTVERLSEALDTARDLGVAGYTVLQNWYNLMERGKFEGPLQQLCVERGVAMAPFYSLANGFLTGKYRSPADLSKSIRGGRVGDYLQGRGPAVLTALDTVAEETRGTPAQVALAWLAAQASVAAPIASATSTDQLEELLAAMDLTLTPAQIAALDEASA